MDTHTIGIDLATGYCCLAYWNEQNNRAEVIVNEHGSRTTPSWVVFHGSERYIGEPAKNMVRANPRSAVYAIKRIIGRTFDDPVVQQEIKLFPFEVRDFGDNRPVVVLDYNGETKKFFPEQISAMLLEKIKKDAESFLGCPVTKAVITVPAYFNDSQRQATKDAAVIAGLEPIRLVAEPTAAAVAYSLDKQSIREKKVIVIDLGSGTLDVSLLAIEDGVIEVISTSGDTHLGGEDYDNRLLVYCAQEFKKMHKLDVTQCPRAVRRLKIACESAKVRLSNTTETSIDVDSLMDGIDMSVRISRAKFEQICDDLNRRPLKSIDNVMLDAKISKSAIDEVVLVGGSSRIPRFQQLVSEYFPGKELCRSINPDEAIALGAAIQAAVLTGRSSEKLDSVVLLDVTPLSLGVETAGDVMTNIISRGTTIPCRKSQVFSTFQDNQTAVTIQIYEGERKFCRDNNLLGTFELKDIKPAPRGTPKIEISLDVDCNGILSVEAVDTATKNKSKLTVTNEKGRLSKKEIERMVKESESYAKQDAENLARVNLRNELDNLIHSARRGYLNTSAREKLSEEDIQMIEQEASIAQAWLQGEGQNADPSSIEEQIKSFSQKIHTVAAKVYGVGENEDGLSATGDFPFGETTVPEGIDPQQWKDILQRFKEQQANMPESDSDSGPDGPDGPDASDDPHSPHSPHFPQTEN